MVAKVVPADPCELVVFGAAGGLARRKLIPALYRRPHDGQMPDGAHVIDSVLWRRRSASSSCRWMSPCSAWARTCTPPRCFPARWGLRMRCRPRPARGRGPSAQRSRGRGGAAHHPVGARPGGGGGGEIPQTFGVPLEEVEKGIKCGVRKVNIDTDIRMAITGAIRKYMAENPSSFDIRGYMKQGVTATQKLCAERFERFGCAGNASRIKPIALSDMAQRYQSGDLRQQVL